MADPIETDVEAVATPSGPKQRRRRPLFVGLVALLILAMAGAGVIWWMHRADDLSVGSKHRVTIVVREVHQGDCINNIDDFTVKGHYFFTHDPSPDQWGTGRVVGTLLITAPPGPGPTAVFGADGRNETVVLSGGLSGVQFSDMACSMGPSSGAPS